MDIIAEIVRNLLVIIIMSSFLEIMLPEGNIKPFVRFAIGLFLLIAILNPALSYIYDDKSFQVSVWDDSVAEKNTQAITDGGQKIEQQIMDQSNAIMKEKMEGQISAVALLVPGVGEVQTELEVDRNGSPAKVKLMVRPGANSSRDENDQVDVFSNGLEELSSAEREQIELKIQQVMGNLYGMKAEDIEIIFEGG
ncbi:MAG: stage III sporulation protein AF [Syntrophomonadaceae bacterium]|nr:stage III sporulation protein AF [Syntrophomonadaceae bacterium]